MPGGPHEQARPLHILQEGIVVAENEVWEVDEPVDLPERASANVSSDLEPFASQLGERANVLRDNSSCRTLRDRVLNHDQVKILTPRPSACRRGCKLGLLF